MFASVELVRRFGAGNYGGSYVSESLVSVLAEVHDAFLEARDATDFQDALFTLMRDFAGRETPMFHARRLSGQLGRNLFLKREDLLHGGAHKTNSTLGQLLLAQRMGKTRIIAETGAGQHGVATAMTGAALGLPVEVYMGPLT